MNDSVSLEVLSNEPLINNLPTGHNEITLNLLLSLCYTIC